VTAPVGGFSVSGDGDVAGRLRLLPLGDRTQVGLVVADVAPGEAPPLLAHPRAGLPRRLVRALAVPVGVAAVAALGGVWWGVAVAAAAVAVMIPVALDRHRNLGHGHGRWLVLRSGTFNRRASRLDPAASVALTIRSSPFQRRRGLCSVDVHLGLGAGSRTALDLGEDQAHALVTSLEPWVRTGR
jgi:putative membrane protein